MGNEIVIMMLMLLLFSSFLACYIAYLVEVFPFTVRAKGIAMEQLWVRASNFISTFVSPIGMDALKWRFYVFYCGWISFEALCIYLLFPETSGRTLEELAFMFEGQEASEEARKRMESILGPAEADADVEKKVGEYDDDCGGDEKKNKRASVQVEEV